MAWRLKAPYPGSVQATQQYSGRAPVRVALERLLKAFAQKRAQPVAPAFLLRMDA